MSRNYPTQAEELANTAVVEAARLAFGQVVLAAVNRASGREGNNQHSKRRSHGSFSSKDNNCSGS